MNKSMKKTTLSNKEKDEIITRKLASIKANVSQGLLINLSLGKGHLGKRARARIVDTAIKMADEYIIKLYTEGANE